MSLSVRDLGFSYGARDALTEVGFSVGAGEFCALLGPNGAGKSTLFALLTRLFTAPGGEILINGHDLRRAPLAAMADLGVVFQSPTLDLDLTVMRNLVYFGALHGIGRGEAKRRGMAALERLGMAERAGEKARDLNGGHRRRVEIARALLHDPAVLLLDEPTVGLDPATRKAITDHVHALCAETGMTVLWATHLTDEVAPTDRLVVLHQGRVRFDGRAAELGAGTELTERFLEITEEAA